MWVLLLVGGFLGPALGFSFCPDNNSATLVLKNPLNCSNYVVCQGHEEIHRECAPGLYFNSELNICDWPYNVLCEISPYTFDGPPCPPNMDPNGEALFIPHPTNCSCYFVCADTDKYSTMMCCPRDQFWSVQYTTCDRKENVDCIVVTMIEPLGLCPITDQDLFYKHNFDSTSYFVCPGESTYNIPNIQKCPQGLYFNAKSNECNLPKSYNK